jgi:putative spermidine/putrescine transport system substrate-binding protein
MLGRLGWGVGVAVSLVVLLGAGPAPGGTNWLQEPFEKIVQAARGTEVRWVMYGGWAHVNSWVDTYVADEMEKRFDIDLIRVPMDASVFVNKLLTEKAAGKDQGTMDLLWINGENFKNAKQAGLLYGPFAPGLPNFKALIDPSSVTSDFGFPVEGHEAPYGRAYFVFEYDTARLDHPPRSFEDLKAWVRDHPGRFTYPQPPDFTGSAFIRQVFCAVTGGHEQYMDGFDAELFERQAPKLWAYLNEIEPHLWQQGRTYPKSSAALDTLLSRGETLLGMSYHPPHAQNKILEGTFPESVRTYVMDEGSLSNTHFTSIPFNAPNVPGAMVLANFLMSVDAQLSKFRPDNWGDFPTLDMGRLTPEDRQRFREVELGPATLSPADLSAAALPEIPSTYLEELENGWEDHVLHE